MNDQERRAEKVELRDRALLAIRQADAFLLVTVFDDFAEAIFSADDQSQTEAMSAALRKLKEEREKSHD